MKQAVTFYSEGLRLSGDLYLPEGLPARQRRAGIVLCHGYTGVKDLYLPDNARVLNAAGYVVLTFDYKGWGASEGPQRGTDTRPRSAARAACAILRRAWRGSDTRFALQLSAISCAS
jgi:predicted alpha/beta hydrolase